MESFLEFHGHNKCALTYKYLVNHSKISTNASLIIFCHASLSIWFYRNFSEENISLYMLTG